MDMDLNIARADCSHFSCDEGAAGKVPENNPTRYVWINGVLVESKLNPEAHEFKPSMHTQWRVAQPTIVYESDEGNVDNASSNDMPMQGYSGDQHGDMEYNLMNHLVMGDAADFSAYPEGDKRLRVLYAKDGVADVDEAAMMNGVVKLMRLDEQNFNLQNNTNEHVKRYAAKEFFPTEEPENLHVLEKVEQFEKINAAIAATSKPEVLPPPPPTPMMARAIVKNREKPPAAVNAEIGNCIGRDSLIAALQKTDVKLHESGGDGGVEKIILQKDTLNVPSADVRMVADAKDGRVPPGTPVGPFVNSCQPFTQDEIKLKVEKKWSLKKLTSFVGSKKPSSKQPPPAKAMLPPAFAAVSSSNTSNSSTFSICSGKKNNNPDKKSPTSNSLQRKQFVTNNMVPPSPHDIRKSEASTRLVARTVPLPPKAAPPQRAPVAHPKGPLPKDNHTQATGALLKMSASPEKARAKATEKSKGKSSHGNHK